MPVPIRSLIALVLVLSLSGPVVRASPPETLGSRDGDNTISFRWNQKTRRVVDADSSRIIIAGASVEILTALRDGVRRIAMRGVIRNVSDHACLRVEGRMVHKVWDASGELIRRLRSRSFNVLLSPGEVVRARFSYLLPSGRYSARTDFVAR